jgi:hypothetical protein
VASSSSASSSLPLLARTVPAPLGPEDVRLRWLTLVAQVQHSRYTAMHVFRAEPGVPSSSTWYRRLFSRLAALLLHLLQCQWRCITFGLLLLPLMRSRSTFTYVLCAQALTHACGAPSGVGCGSSSKSTDTHLAVKAVVLAHVLLVLGALDLQVGLARAHGWDHNVPGHWPEHIKGRCAYLPAALVHCPARPEVGVIEHACVPEIKLCRVPAVYAPSKLSLQRTCLPRQGKCSKMLLSPAKRSSIVTAFLGAGKRSKRGSVCSAAKRESTEALGLAGGLAAGASAPAAMPLRFGVFAMCSCAWLR